jgi:hypothetical protein
MNLHERLQASSSRTAASCEEWQPRSFDLSDPTDTDALAALFRVQDIHFVHDTITAQLGDLVASRTPGHRLTPADRDARILTLLGGRPLHQYGRWIYYPWSARLVHVLPREEFRALRSDRNRDKITPEEQDRLRSFRIGIVGLSVGQSVALTMALEGVGGAFRLADFDSLGLSNLNRLRASIADLGVNKSVLAARQLAELDPYLDIQVFPDGVTKDNLDDFFNAGGPLDLLIEECDDLYAKVRLREEARRLRVPVLMDTSDRGLIDIERFDLEPDRPLLHGLVGATRANELKGLSPEDRIAFVFKILDYSRLSTRMQGSLLNIHKTLETWPQLGSGVTLGGALTTDVARRLLLGELTCSGRFYVDLEEILRDGAGGAIDREGDVAGCAGSPKASGLGVTSPRPRLE